MVLQTQLTAGWLITQKFRQHSNSRERGMMYGLGIREVSSTVLITKLLTGKKTRSTGNSVMQKMESMTYLPWLTMSESKQASIRSTTLVIVKEPHKCFTLSQRIKSSGTSVLKRLLLLLLELFQVQTQNFLRFWLASTNLSKRAQQLVCMSLVVKIGLTNLKS